MSAELIYTLRKVEPGERFTEKTVLPKGRFSLPVRKQDYRYYITLEGAMTFTGDDFDFIFSAKDASEFFLACDFGGIEWKGYFTKMDCDIHADKRYLEVEPRPDDDYRNVEPYMGVDLNILPALGGHKADTEVSGIRTYRKERITVEIDEPYTSPVGYGKEWVGYSVNDWIWRDEPDRGYGDLGSLYNSLGHTILKKKRYNDVGYSYRYQVGTTVIEVEVVGWGGYFNTLAWLDYSGFGLSDDLDDVDGLVSLLRNLMSVDYSVPELYTLVEIINHYDDNGDFERCELIYEREIYEGEGKPEGNITPQFEALYDAVKSGDSVTYQDYISENAARALGISVPYHHRHIWLRGVPIRGWVYDYNNNYWVRRPLGIGDIIEELSSRAEYEAWTDSDYKTASLQFGDGYWYSELSAPIDKDGGHIRKQVLCKNLNYGGDDDDDTDIDYDPTAMYEDLYGYMTIKGKYHRIESLLRKFLQHIENEGGDTLPLVSRYVTDSTLAKWSEVLVAHNSDVKRPEALEKADDEQMSFHDFLMNICALTNAGWAVVNGKFYLEHTQFFENGFRYDDDDDDDDTDYINPLSIYNISKNKTFLEMSNRYRYDRPNMQKYEVFITSGGEEPKHHKTKIAYDSPIVNNYPEQNTREITLDRLATDIDWVITEAPEAGLSIIACDLEEMEGSAPGDIATGVRIDFYLPDGDTLKLRLNKGSSSELFEYDSVSDNMHDTLLAIQDEFNTQNPFGTMRIVSIRASRDGGYIKIQNSDGVDVKREDIEVIEPLNFDYLVAVMEYNYIVGATGWVLYKYSIPLSFDEHLRYKINEGFTLEDIVKEYHTNGRSFTVGEVNGDEVDFTTRPYILQDIFFPYRQTLNPYNKVVTELGVGAIREASIDTMSGIVEMTLGFREGDFITPTGLPPPLVGVFFHRHVQAIASKEWYISHKLGTDAILRPIVYSGDEEIGYAFIDRAPDGYRESDDWLMMGFSRPTMGEAYFLSFEKYTVYKHEQISPQPYWNIAHNLDTTNILHSIVWSGTKEIRYDSFQVTNKDNAQLNFTKAVSGVVYVIPSPVSPQEIDDDDEATITRTHRYPLKPLVLHADGSEVGYDSNTLETALVRLGFTKKVIANIILKQHD